MPRPPKVPRQAPRPPRRRGRPPTSSSAKPGPRWKTERPSSLSSYLSTFQEYQPIEWVPSGIAAIDLVIGGGIPRGRFIEVMGEPSTAKSAFGYTVIGAFQRAGAECLLIDSEAKADRAFMERLGVDFTKLHYSRGEDLKKCVQMLGNVAEMADPKSPVLIVWDSIAGTPGTWESNEHMDEKEFTGEKASRARYLSAALRAFSGKLSRKMVTFIGINQLRTQFNFMGSTSLTTPGGKAPKFTAAVRLMMRMKGKIKHRTHDVITGMMVDVEAAKNTLAPPFRHCQVRLNFDSGFAPYSGLDELLLRHGRIQQKGGWLLYKDKSFHAGDIERIITEVPDLIAPLTTSIGDEQPAIDLGSSAEPKEEAPSQVEAPAGEE